MEAVLRSVVTSPGVIGGMIVDDNGQLLVRSMPDVYDSNQLARVGTLLAEQQFGLEEATGGVKQADIRFELGKLVARSAGAHALVLLCESGVNPNNKINAIAPLYIIEDDKENLFDSRVLITLATAEHLQLQEGERVIVEVPKGTGLFGWEGI